MENGTYRVKSSVGFYPGDVVAYPDGEGTAYTRVVKSRDNVLSFEHEIPASVVDTNLVPLQVITTCEALIEVRYEDIMETYENVSLNINEVNYIGKKMAKSDLVAVSGTAGRQRFQSPRLWDVL